MTSISPPHLAGVTLRAAHADDAADIARIAALDSRRTPTGPLLLAEENGVLRAAFATTTGDVVADPFAPTEHLVALLRRHAARRAAPPGWSARLQPRIHRLALQR